MLNVGCVTIRVEKPDGTKYSYSRWLGDQNLEGVSMTTPDGASFSIGKQSGANSLDKTLENVSETLKNISETATKIPL
jgi:hypothetical protein